MRNELTVEFNYFAQLHHFPPPAMQFQRTNPCCFVTQSPQTSKAFLSQMTLPRLLVVFGLRGTLLERIHMSGITPALPQATSVVGQHKIWLRPKTIETLTELSAVCDVAIWSSTTKRNTDPVVSAVFPKMDFKFVWTRDNTIPDDFRRSVAVDKEDQHATIKDLHSVWEAYPQYTRERTVIVDDTPSKGKMNADNLIWLRSCQQPDVLEEQGMPLLKKFVLDELVSLPDVRSILPKRI